MLLLELPTEIILYILKYIDESEDFLPKDIVYFVTCNKELMNTLIDLQIKFYKPVKLYSKNITDITLPYFKYDNIYNDSKKLYVKNIDNINLKMTYLKDLYIDLMSSSTSSLKYLPKSVTHLAINTCAKIIENLPENLTHLTVHNEEYFKMYKIPQSLIYLNLMSYYGDIDHYPSKLKQILFKTNYLWFCRDKLPDNLTHLTLGEFFWWTY